jgi:alpha-tubulin suppressor-like RCC1 family protein
MLGINTLIEKLNVLIAAGSLSELQVTQLSGAIDTLEKRGVSRVNEFRDLPNPALNKGRFFWIESEQRYVLSDGFTWNINNVLSNFVNLYAWGFNNNSQLGFQETSSNSSSPLQVSGSFTDWIQVSGGSSHSLGVRANGTLWAWGFNNQGRLGDNTIVSKRSPVSVVGGFTDWVQASAGGAHSLGVRANGTLWAWGANANDLFGTGGLLGDNTIVSKSSPVSVVGGFTDWIQASAGGNHSLGVRANGTLWAWGANNIFGTGGLLGDNTTVNKSSPVSVVGGFTDWIQASAGSYHSLGVRANGTLWAWGSNGFASAPPGQLGDNTTVNKSSPVSVVGGFTDWIQASAGFYHSLGVRANGTLWSWGRGLRGQLGDNTTIDKSSPVSVVGGFTDWVQASASGHSLGIRANGTLWTWGYNSTGQLGDNTTVSRSSPVSVVGGFTDWVQASSSAVGSHSLGIRG